MKPRAAMFDVYGTLLEVGPAPPDADEQWRSLWKQLLNSEPRLSRLDFSAECNRLIARQHQSAHARGISHPEVYWPSIVSEALPELTRLPRERQEDFLLQQIRTGHTTHVGSETVKVLRRLKDRGCLLGIASNAQAYTLRELQEGLAAHGESLKLFEPDLCFWSFKHGFSKPDPHVFQLLSARLEARGISRAATLIVGDRRDNDIEPARAQGWQAWHLGPVGQGCNGGWADFAKALLQDER